MKQLLTGSYEGTKLTVLIEPIENEHQKIQAIYFINGAEIENFEKVKPIFTSILIGMAQNYCQENKLILWKH